MVIFTRFDTKTTSHNESFQRHSSVCPKREWTGGLTGPRGFTGPRGSLVLWHRLESKLGSGKYEIFWKRANAKTLPRSSNKSLQRLIYSSALLVRENRGEKNINRKRKSLPYFLCYQWCLADREQWWRTNRLITVSGSLFSKKQVRCYRICNY